VISVNSVATLITDVTVQRIDGVNPDHSPVLGKTAAEPCVQRVLERLELPPGDWAASATIVVRQDFCTPTVKVALRATRGYVDAYRVWWREHRNQTCPSTLSELSELGENHGLDPWQQPYVMRCDATGFQVLSGGPDLKVGTADDVESHR